ncbi:MAG TPA: HNH endonuclease [Synergistaceae bacterium]|nr:HNH endonuclease [Synergistaceae bacterium]
MPRKPGEQYATKRRKDKERRYNKFRPARHEFYATSEWRRLRDWYRAGHPLCEECQRQGRVTAAELVHHKVEISEGGKSLDVDNLESLCWSCHSKVHGFK